LLSADDENVERIAIGKMRELRCTRSVISKALVSFSICFVNFLRSIIKYKLSAITMMITTP